MTSIKSSIDWELLEQLKKNEIDVTYVAVDTQTGCVSAYHIIAAIRPETCLITVMLANNETGVLQSVEEIGRKLRPINEQRVTQPSPEVLFHSDAAQGFGKMSVDVEDLGVHYMTIVGHNFHGPRIGTLCRRSGFALLPIFLGGRQKKGHRRAADSVTYD